MLIAILFYSLLSAAILLVLIINSKLEKKGGTGIKPPHPPPRPDLRNTKNGCKGIHATEDEY